MAKNTSVKKYAPGTCGQLEKVEVYQKNNYITVSNLTNVEKNIGFP